MATWKSLWRRGKDVKLSEDADHTFEDTAGIDGDTVENLKSVYEDTSWSQENRNTATFTNESKNSATWANQNRN